MFSARSVVRTGNVLLSIALLLAAGILRDAGSGSAVDRSSQGPSDRLAPAAFAPPFVENLGQVRNAEVAYTSLSGRLVAGYARGAVDLVLMDARDVAISEDPSARVLPTEVRRLLIRVAFEGSVPVAPVGLDERPGRSHYFLGDNPTGWRTGIRGFDRVAYAGLYEGVDLVYRSDPSGLKYEFHIRPGADPDRIILRYEGAEEIRLDPVGGLVVRTGLGALRDSPPTAHASGREIACTFALRGPQAVGFDCEGWDGSDPLVIDPLLYSTLLGGADEDIARGIAVDSAGNAYVTGTTWSADFPTTPGVVEADLSGQTDVFVAKLNPSGTSLLYATFLGGGGHEEGYAIDVDADGNAFITGYTTSPAFPTTRGAFDVSYNNNEDIFAAKLNPSGTALLYSTFLGGRALDVGHSIAVDSAGAAYLTGYTNSTNFPTTFGALRGVLDGAHDGVVVKLDPSGSDLAYATYLGGSSSDFSLGLRVDAAGHAFVAGSTLSFDFPTTAGSFAQTSNGSYDAFVAKLDPSGTAFVYSTYLGGRHSDQGNGVAVDAAGNAVVVGNTVSRNFPTTPNAYDRSLNGLDGFVAKLDPDGSDLVYSTYLGGVSLVYAYAVAVDAAGDAFVTGSTRAMDFPTTSDAHDVTYNGEFDAFLTEFSPDGGRILYSTFFGALQDDIGFAVAVDAAGNAYLAGMASSDSFPTTPGAYDPSFHGRNDAFVAKFTLGPPPGVSTIWIAAGLVGATALAVALWFIARRGRRPPAGRKPLRLRKDR